MDYRHRPLPLDTPTVQRSNSNIQLEIIIISDGATVVVINLMFRSFPTISDNKMVRYNLIIQFDCVFLFFR